MESDLRRAQFDKETAMICFHHLRVFEKYYSTKYVTCNNTFGSHKKKVKGTHIPLLHSQTKLVHYS